MNILNSFIFALGKIKNAITTSQFVSFKKLLADYIFIVHNKLTYNVFVKKYMIAIISVYHEQEQQTLSEDSFFLVVLPSDCTHCYVICQWTMDPSLN